MFFVKSAHAWELKMQTKSSWLDDITLKHLDILLTKLHKKQDYLRTKWKAGHYHSI